MPKKKNKPTKTKMWIFSWIFLIVIGLGYSAYDLFIKYPNDPGPGEGQILELEIPKGAGPADISRILHEKGLIESPGKFRLWLRYSGQLPGINAGTFRLKDHMRPSKIVAVLQGKGIEKGVRITVPEGFKISDIAALIEKEEISSAAAFISAATDQTTLAKLGIPGPTAEGFLFPDTYYFEKNVTAIHIIEKMHGQFQLKYKALAPPDNRVLLDVVTLASIVQAEARVLEEAPTIAGVYRNRIDGVLFSSKLMQADPTVAYGCDPIVDNRAPSCSTFKGVLGRKQLDDPANSYNTYRHPGLPPGPICAPGVAALQAALHPKKVPYLYFVAGKNGQHRFSTTLKEHNEAVRIYRANKERD